MSAQQKQEHKIMDEKIAKVREVVRNFSKTQIVLVLHHFDLNVEKTIQAFVHGTYEEALGDWEQKGNGSAKNKSSKKKKSKSAKATTENGSNASGKSTPAVPAKPVIGNNTGYVANAAVTSLASATPTAATATITNGIVTRKDEKTANVSAPQVQQNSGQPGSGTSKKSKKSKQSGVIAEVSADELARFQALEDSAKLNAIAVEASHLSSYIMELDELEKNFNNQISLSQNALMQYILEIKQRLSERERQLSAELTCCRDEASRLFNSRRAKLIELSGKAITPPKPAQEREALFKTLKGFNAAKAQDKTIANATRLHADHSKIYDAIAQFGEVVPAKQTAAITSKPIVSNGTVSETKVPASNGKSNNLTTTTVQQPLELNGHANGYEKILPQSRASVVSDVSSDVSQISPKAEEKKVTQVTSSGIFMQSDGLSADEMAQIQKQIEETLRAKGIDPSILSEMGMNTTAPRKRPQNKNANEKRGNAGGGKGSAGGKAQQQAAQPKLSILS